MTEHRIKELINECRQLGIRVSLEALQDLKNMHGVDIEVEEFLINAIKSRKKKTLVDKLVDALEPKC